MSTREQAEAVQQTATGEPSPSEVRYNPAEIEARWQERWAAQPELYAAEPTSSNKPKYYLL